MTRFEDQPSIGKQDQGYRSDEVRGPYREAWAEKPEGPIEDRTDSPGGGSGLGENQNPAWAGAQASLESDTAGRGMYGAGEEGALGYGDYQTPGGEMPSSKTTDQSHKQESSKTATAAPADEGFGTRHWGHGEFKGDDETKDTADEPNVIARAVETVGRFFGVGPKNYRRSNERIYDDVCEALQNHHEIDASEIEVKVKDGVVSLSGTVSDREARRLVEGVLSQIPGIADVENHLRTENYVARTEEADKLKTEAENDGPTLHS